MRAQVTVQDVGVDGEGVARHEGLVLFIPGAAPGDVCLVEWQEGRGRVAKARLLSVVQPSPQRVKAPCPAFGRCGGCDLQHLSYPGELAVKTRRVRDALLRIGGIDAAVGDCIAAPEPYGYRAKLSWPVRGAEGRLLLGLYQRHTHGVVEEDSCAVAHPLLRALPELVRGLGRELGISAYDEKSRNGLLRHVVARRSLATGEILVTLVATREDPLMLGLAKGLMAGGVGVTSVALNVNAAPGNAVFGRETRVLTGPGEILERVLGLSFRIGPTAFFQVNPAGAERLFSTALSMVGDARGRALDLYTGTGVFALLLARAGCDVTGVESWPEAITMARRNAIENGLRAEFLVADAAAHPISPELDLVALDPPRSGAEAACTRIAAKGPQSVLYISCDPGTLARDAKILASGGYLVEMVQPVDMFPQTVHVETVALFRRG